MQSFMQQLVTEDASLAPTVVQILEFQIENLISSSMERAGRLEMELHDTQGVLRTLYAHIQHTGTKLPVDLSERIERILKTRGAVEMPSPCCWRAKNQAHP